MSLDLVLPFLKPIEQFILDPSVSEIMVNDDGSTHIQQDGRMFRVSMDPLPLAGLEQAIKRIARLSGEEIGPSRPVLNATLEGSEGLPYRARVAAMWPPCSGARPSLVIRKYRPNWFKLNELVDNGTMSNDQAMLLVRGISDRKNILVSGKTDSGKTTVAKALVDHMGTDRLGIIEDTEEIVIHPNRTPNVFRFFARKKLNDTPAVDVRELVKQCLRYRPDRIIIGELRGAEAFDLIFDALNSGHEGSLSTIHATSAEDALERVCSLAMYAGVKIPFEEVRRMVHRRIDIVVQVARGLDGKRRVVCIQESSSLPRLSAMHACEAR